MSKAINFDSPAAKLQGMHIFLLDDQASSGSMLSSMIAKLNVANITVCKSLNEAYRILSTTSPDVIMSRYYLESHYLATYFFRELKHRNISRREQVNVCLVSETETYKDDSLDFTIDSCITTPCSADTLKKGMLSALRLKETLLKLEDIIHGEDPRKTIASGVLLAGEHKVATKSLLKLICRKLLSDGHFEDLEDILNILTHKISDPWIDLITVKMLIDSDRDDAALNYIEDKKQWHDSSSDLFLLEAKVHYKNERYVKSVEVLNSMLKSRRNDISIYHEIIDVLSCTKEQENIYDYLKVSCSIGFKTELRRKSDYIRLCEIIIEELSISETPCINKLSDLEKTLNMIYILFDEKVETKVIAAIFHAKNSLLRKREDDVLKHADAALEIYNTNNVLLSPKHMQMLKEVFMAVGCSDKAEIVDNIAAGNTVKEDNEILLKINEFYISEHSVKLLAYARESIIAVLACDKKKISSVVCLLRPGNIALFQGVDFFQTIVNKMVDELLSYKLEKSDLELFVYATSINAVDGDSDTKVSAVDQILKSFSSIGMLPNRTVISTSEHIQVIVDVVSKETTVVDVDDEEIIKTIVDREYNVTNIEISVDQVEQKPDDAASSMDSA